MWKLLLFSTISSIFKSEKYKFSAKVLGGSNDYHVGMLKKNCQLENFKRHGKSTGAAIQ